MVSCSHPTEATGREVDKTIHPFKRMPADENLLIPTEVEFVTTRCQESTLSDACWRREPPLKESYFQGRGSLTDSKRADVPIQQAGYQGCWDSLRSIRIRIQSVVVGASFYQSAVV